MSGTIVYVSAPYDVRGIAAADIPWEALPSFQPLLGQDAQMAAFAAVAKADGVQIRVLAAPEIYGDGLAAAELRAQSGDRVLVHVRFGSPRLPRILKRAINAVVLAEDTTIPTRLGRHPFAAGAALPAAVNTVLQYEPMTPAPERIGKGPPSRVVLPSDFTTADLPDSAPVNAWGEATLQRCAEFRSTAWRRAVAPASSGNFDRMLAHRPAVLLPWNLAAPGSLVPNLLRKICLLADQGRFPLTVVVLPYNDAPGSLTLLEQAAASCAGNHSEPGDSPAILLARAGSIDASLALLQLCQRAWIDAADPEWRWTLRRIAACGLLVNFVSDVPTELSAEHDPGPFAADEMATRHSNGRAGPLFWRNRVLSLRRLASLADAVGEGRDHPLHPQSPAPANPAIRSTLQDLLTRYDVSR